MDTKKIEEFKKEADDWLRLVARTLYQMSKEVDDPDLSFYILVVYEEVVTTPPEEMIKVLPLIAQLEEVVGEETEHGRMIQELIRVSPTPIIPNSAADPL